MDKILSARVEEEILQKISLIASELKTSKKSVIESAINEYAKKIEQESKIDPLELTLGAWKRDESADETVISTKRKFAQSMKRHH